MRGQQRQPTRIEVWSWRLDADELFGESAETLLSEDEKVRSRNFSKAQLRHRFAGGRARMRMILGAHLGFDPRALVFVRNAFGKPSLVLERPLHFSLSHSDDQAVLAVSEAVEVGADIERIRALDPVDLATRYFAANEAAVIAGLPGEEERLEAFFRTWTLKEAVVKALGKGLSILPDTFEVSPATTSPALVRVPEGAPRTWWLHVATTSDRYCRALAAPVAGDVELIQRTV